MRMPAIVKANTLPDEVRSMIEDARTLPADGQVYERGDVRMCHEPQSKLTRERVFVYRYGQKWRSSFDGQKWTAIDEIGGVL